MPNRWALPCPEPSVPWPPESAKNVARGDALLTLEAMKMETTVRAEQDGVVKEALAKPGQAVDAKDLLVVFE